ncbi:DUF1707 SHOCT-like domain-containing protein [Propionibacteriaceae bacterium G57]|uniref:DUF1707 SHOCT-like domain-containing protein n=1 Tax=Aestuariimicrobium sp. G57 TaxID=3418485 RepID=UPI003DA72018
MDQSAPAPAPLPRPIAATVGPRPGLRIGDAERDHMCEVLGAHYAAGRLSLAELGERTDLAVKATTAADLHQLARDLPALAPASATVPNAIVPNTIVPNTIVPHTMVHVQPAPVPTALSVAAQSLFGLVSIAAAACTMLLLLGTMSMRYGEFVWLAAFGAAVASSGFTWFVSAHAHRSRLVNPAQAPVR